MPDLQLASDDEVMSRLASAAAALGSAIGSSRRDWLREVRSLRAEAKRRRLGL